MTDPEIEIVKRLIARLDRLIASATGDLAWLGDVPHDLSSFDSMESHRQSAARATLKSFEQIEDQLSRVFRIIPKLMGEDTRRWFARDHGDYMERFGLIEDAATWSAVVKLRNQLVHDYPLDPQIQFERLVEAIGYLPMLSESHRRIVVFVRDVLPGKSL